ncbi:MAG: hypothetical protein AAFX56_12245 [Pseudomonadota bacterium]
MQRNSKKTEVNPKVTTSVRVPVNTRQRAKFDIHAVKLHEVVLRKPRMRGAMLRADDLSFNVVLQNAGSNTFAFSGNQIDASIIEGHFDYRQRVSIDRRRVPYYPARGTFDIIVQRGGSIELPIVIRGQKTKRVAFWPVPSPFRRRPDVTAIQLESGNAPIEIRPAVWYTIDARLVPAGDDEIEHQHSVFVNLRFDRNGGVAELQGPYLY